MGQGADIQGITEGTLLGGRVVYRQFTGGHRTGFEPVLLAAAVPAVSGDHVLEAGTGAGAALLCLAARVPGVTCVGVETESQLVDLANENFKINEFSNVSAINADAASLPFAPQTFHHAFANPPWFPATTTASPNRLRALAHQAGPDLLPAWIASLTTALRPRGSLTLILPAAALSLATSALRPRFGAITLCPLWPRAGEPAKMFLLAARKGSKSPDRILPGLVLHNEEGITKQAEEIFREGKAVLF
jgi:tRNA1(Val) A37 N6-methylase TrmN6